MLLRSHVFPSWVRNITYACTHMPSAMVPFFITTAVFLVAAIFFPVNESQTQRGAHMWTMRDM